MKKYYSCKDIESSLYIAPNEIRACCQRFFHEGKMRGDAKLLEIEDGSTPKANNIKNSRKKLFDKIQLNQSESCNGCPFLYETNEEPNFNSNIEHLSIEHHSVCNLRCTYCSDTYYGGKRSKYNVVEFIKYLSDSGSFTNCKQVVWGGGEPTLDKSFELIVEEIDKFANPNIYHRVFTNSVRYHESVIKFLEKGLIKIVTSIDAGSELTFKKVRGRDKFFNVFENLSKYSKIDPSKITIKYIFTEENSDEEELINFVKHCVSNNLNNCAYQISMNYKYENLSLDMLKKVSFLMNELKKNNINKFFPDDHIAARFKKLDKIEKKQLLDYSNEKRIENIFLNYGKIKNLNIYGIGDIAINILNKTNVLDVFDEIQLFDSDSSKVGTVINNCKIKNPDEIKLNDFKIFISTAQSYDDIYQKLTKMNIDTGRLISGIFI